MTDSTSSNSVPLGRYVLIFGMVYIGLLVLVQCITFAAHLRPGLIITLLEYATAACFTTGFFVRNQRRLPTHFEARRLSWLSFWVIWLIPAVVVAIAVTYLFVTGAENNLLYIIRKLPAVPLWAWFAVVLVASAVIYGTLALAYGPLTRRIFRSVAAKNAQ